MRTDVKVGLICAFMVVLGVIIYFVVQGNTHQARAEIPAAGSNPAAGSRTPAVDPTGPTPGLERTLAAGPVGGGPIIPPAPSATVPATLPGYGAPPMTYTPAATSPAVIRTPGSSDPLIPSPRTTMTFGPTPGATDTTTGTTYKIQKGDMLGTIAKKYGVSVKAIEIANPGINSNNLKIDSSIKIPAAPALATPLTPTTHTPAATAPSVTTVVSATPKAGATYKVKKGDTLTNIAKAAYGSGTKATIQKIVQANRAITDPNTVAVGAELKLP